MASTYKTKSGDMWDEIAWTQLGSESYMGDLLAANPEYSDQWRLQAGITLTIPDVETANSVLPPWKQ